MSSKFFKFMCFFVFMLYALLLAGCLETTQRLEAWQVEDWRRDLDYLEDELPQKHVNLFHSLDEAQFNSRIDALKSALVEMNEDEIKIEMQKIVAAAGDEHTATNISAKEMYPLDLMWLKDGWYVINTSSEYGGVLYARLASINGHDIQEVEAAVAEVISHSNRSWLKAQAKYYLPLRGVLHGLGFIDEQPAVRFTFIDSHGNSIEHNMRPMDGGKVFDDIIGKGKENEQVPLYMQNGDQAYWFRVLDEAKIIYFKYNTCREMDEKPTEDFLDELILAMAENETFALVVDLRDNQGGDSSLLEPFIEAAAQSRQNRDRKLYVLTGRRTYSSAVLNAVGLKMKTSAVFIGEPTGGKPIHFGETSSFRLPESKIRVTYSTKYFDRILDGDAVRPVPFTEDSLYPDVDIEPGIDDYRENRDVFLQYILNLQEQQTEYE